ncbi:MAG: tetraacyldisaccharide 4'-kinase [Alphaproteobacteria bacterium]|nr:tetraacyldisaccharide 4'-kinase [Alphaproteobacteria bacterium]
MKTPRFWYPPAKNPDRLSVVLPNLLAPLSWGFAAAGGVRRLVATPFRPQIPVICVGNVVAGGAGKTPVALALAGLFRDYGEKPVFVTRGYGGNGENIHVEPQRHHAEEVGDEALLLAAAAPTWAGSDRKISMLQAQAHGTCIIMDDGMQNPFFAPTASLLVVDGETGLGNGHMMPAGPLRESFGAAVRRAAAMIIIGRDKHRLAAQSRKYKRVPVFQAHIRPAMPVGNVRKGKFIAFAGIARPEKFYQTAKTLKLNIVGTADFPDHHLYTQTDIDALRLRAEEQGARLLTTEKDAVRLPPDFRAETVILPIHLAFEAEDAGEKLVRLCLGLV